MNKIHLKHKANMKTKNLYTIKKNKINSNDPDRMHRLLFYA
jgi:hypothetical protein